MSTVEQRFSPENESLLNRLETIRLRMKLAAEKSGREASSVCLVAVTKTVEPPLIRQALDLNITDIAENKVQEAQLKRSQLPVSRSVTHHLIGHLQTNKVRKALELFDVIQTLDRPRLAEMVDRIATETGKRVRGLVEVKLGDEPTKTGMPIAQAFDFVKTFSSYKHIELAGLMAIAPLDLSEDQTRNCFRTLKNLFDRCKPFFCEHPILSMGMSDDYELAIEEGSTMIRLGRALFGERSA